MSSALPAGSQMVPEPRVGALTPPRTARPQSGPAPMPLAYLGLAVALIGVSFSAIFIKLASSPALTIASNRMLAAVLLLLVPTVLGGWRGLLRIRRGDVLALALSGLSLAVHFGLWTSSLDDTSVASSVVFVSTSPVFVALCEWLLFSQRLRPTGWVGIGLTLVGSAVIGWSDLQVGRAALLGDGLALGGGVALVGYLLIGRRLRQRLSVLSYTLPVYAVAWLGLLIWASASGQDVRAFPTRDLVWFVALAIASTLAGHTVFNWALRHVPASLVAVTMVGEPVVAALLAWVILSQAVGPLVAVGGLIILGGIWLTARGRG